MDLPAYVENIQDHYVKVFFGIIYILFEMIGIYGAFSSSLHYIFTWNIFLIIRLVTGVLSEAISIISIIFFSGRLSFYMVPPFGLMPVNWIHNSPNFIQLSFIIWAVGIALSLILVVGRLIFYPYTLFNILFFDYKLLSIVYNYYLYVDVRDNPAKYDPKHVDEEKPFIDQSLTDVKSLDDGKTI